MHSMKTLMIILKNRIKIKLLNRIKVSLLNRIKVNPHNRIKISPSLLFNQKTRKSSNKKKVQKLKKFTK
jgi:hypothetical protein